jgi:hypothetical protein
MPKPRSRRDNNLRRHIAYLAARLMAEDGVTDYATAKSKAARQAGLAESHLLPDNAEVEAALREYQGLYQKDDQPAHLRRLREIAVKVMRDFDAFRPALVGSVLTGTAGQYSDVNLQIFTDDPKSLALFLLNRRYRYEEGLAPPAARRWLHRGPAGPPERRQRAGHAHDPRPRRRARGCARAFRCGCAPKGGGSRTSRRCLRRPRAQAERSRRAQSSA